jgi:glutamine synthetase
VDQAERDRRRDHAEELRDGLAEAGVSVVATSFVDNAGISRAKSVPLDRLAHLAAWGVGFSPAFDFFRSDDWVAAPASGEGPVGDQRIIPDLDRLVVLDAQPAGRGRRASATSSRGRRTPPTAACSCAGSSTAWPPGA